MTQAAHVLPDCLIVAGPTASGKSALAVALARQHNGVVINADSMQVYREIPVLSAQPMSRICYTDSARLWSIFPRRNGPLWLCVPSKLCAPKGVCRFWSAAAVFICKR